MVRKDSKRRATARSTASLAGTESFRWDTVADRQPVDDAEWDVTLRLPLPPSVNDLHQLFVDKLGQPRKARTGKYVKWLKMAEEAVRRAMPDAFPLPAPYAVHVTVFVSRRRDIDNCLKATLDMLEHTKLIVNDRFVDSVGAKRIYSGKGRTPEMVVIRVATMKKKEDEDERGEDAGAGSQDARAGARA